MASSTKALFRSVPALVSNTNIAACVVLACLCYTVWGFIQNLTFSIDRYLTSYGYSRNPPKVPLSEEVSKDDNNPFNRGSWDCANRLFKKLTIDHKSPAVTTKKVSSESVSKLFSYVPSSNNSSPVIPFLVSPHIKESLVVCALVDLREGTNKTYFKSEVAGKSVSAGWILWSGYSKDRFEHRLIILKFKFEEDKWEIDKQFFWKKADDMNVYIGGEGSSKDFTLGTVETEGKK